MLKEWRSESISVFKNSEFDSGYIARWLMEKISRRIFLSVVFSILGTFFCYQLNLSTQKNSAVENSLLWSRQVVSQVESLVYDAKERGIRDPLGFAIRMLTIGQEDRPIKIVKMTQKIGEAKERHSLNIESSQFDYWSDLSMLGGQGIRIHLKTPYVGYLGMKSRLGEDAVLFLTFLAFMLLSWLAFYRVCSELINRAQLETKNKKLKKLTEIEAERDSIKNEFEENQLTINRLRAELEVMGEAIENFAEGAKSEPLEKLSKFIEGLEVYEQVLDSIDNARENISDLKENVRLTQSSLGSIEAVTLSGILELSQGKANVSPYKLLTALHSEVKKAKAQGDILMNWGKRLEEGLTPILNDLEDASTNAEELATLPQEFKYERSKILNVVKQVRSDYFDEKDDDLLGEPFEENSEDLGQESVA